MAFLNSPAYVLTFTIVDTDGCFINDENVICGDTDIVYNDDTICAKEGTK